VWVATAFLSVAFTAAFVFVKTFVTTTGLNSVGPFFAAYALMAVSWRLAFAGVPDRVGLKRMVGPGMAAYAIGVAIVGVMGDTSGLVIGGLFAGLGHGISYPVILAIATTRAPEGDRGTVTAIFTAVFDLVLFGIAPLIGLVISAFGYTTTFLSVAVSVIAGIVIFYGLERGLSGTTDITTEPATAPARHG
jgi:MFS family permease